MRAWRSAGRRPRRSACARVRRPCPAELTCSICASSARLAGERGRRAGHGDQVDVLHAVRHPARRSRELHAHVRAPGALAQARGERLAELERGREQQPRRGALARAGLAARRARPARTSRPGRARCARAGRAPPRAAPASESTPSSECSSRVRLGPTPGRRVIAISPGGNFAFSLTRAAGIDPVSASATIFSCSVLPIPGISVARPARASAATGTDASRTALAALR